MPLPRAGVPSVLLAPHSAAASVLHGRFGGILGHPWDVFRTRSHLASDHAEEEGRCESPERRRQNSVGHGLPGQLCCTAEGVGGCGWQVQHGEEAGLASIPLDPNEYSRSSKLQCIATNLTAAFRTGFSQMRSGLSYVSGIVMDYIRQCSRVRSHVRTPDRVKLDCPPGGQVGGGTLRSTSSWRHFMSPVLPGVDGVVVDFLGHSRCPDRSTCFTSSREFQRMAHTFLRS